MELQQTTQEQEKRIKFFKALGVLTDQTNSNYSNSKESGSPSGITTGYEILATFKTSRGEPEGLRLKYYPRVTKRLRCMMIVRRVWY
jgi:hypothetical protein